MASEFHNLSERLFTAFETGDADEVAACYAPETRVWHNFNGVEMTGQEHLASIKSVLFVEFSERKYTDIRYEEFEHGFFRQHILTGFWRDVPINFAICAVCRVAEGKVIRLDEYMHLPFPA